VAGLVLSAAPLLAFVAPSSPASAASATLFASPTGVSFGDVPLGTLAVQGFFLQNTGFVDETINFPLSGFPITGDVNDFGVAPDPTCQPTPSTTIDIAPGGVCTIDVVFAPGALGSRNATVTIQGSTGSSVTLNLSGTGGTGYYEVDSRGDVMPTGDALYFGDTGGTPLNHPVVGIAPTGDDGGYWLVASDGGVFSYGDASFHGSMGGTPLNKPVVGMAATPDGGGYWQVASDGGIFAFGDAPFYGSTGNIHLNQPIVGMAATPHGGGYWMVASDGGIFSFGDAPFLGSMGGTPLNQPIVGIAPTPQGGGYWMAASDGGIFNFGNADFFGSMGGKPLNAPIVGLAANVT